MSTVKIEKNSTTVYVSADESERKAAQRTATKMYTDKKLSCRSETARRSVLLKILLSLKVAKGHSKLRH